MRFYVAFLMAMSLGIFGNAAPLEMSLLGGDIEESYDDYCGYLNGQWECVNSGCQWDHYGRYCYNPNNGGGNYRQCYEIRSPDRCNDRRDCYWNHRTDRCVSHNGGGGDYRQCREIYSPNECSYRSDCYWSRRTNSCVSNNGGGGDDYPRRCYYIRDRYECDQNYPCHWSHAFDRCVGPNDA